MLAALLSPFRSKEPKRPRPAHPLAIANAIMDEIDRTGQKAGIIRLQRLAVLSQGWSLALNGEAMYDAATVILVDTPAIPSIHSAFRRYGSGDVTTLGPEGPSFSLNR